MDATETSPVHKISWFISIETFRAAAEANSDDILKLYNTKGNLVNISPKLPENTPDTRYKLEVVALHCNGREMFVGSLISHQTLTINVLISSTNIKCSLNLLLNWHNFTPDNRSPFLYLWRGVSYCESVHLSIDNFAWRLSFTLWINI